MSEKTVKELCAEYNIKQVELARRFNIPARTVEDWCRGVRVPPSYVVRMMENLLKLNVTIQEQG